MRTCHVSHPPISRPIANPRARRPVGEGGDASGPPTTDDIRLITLSASPQAQRYFEMLPGVPRARVVLQSTPPSQGVTRKVAWVRISLRTIGVGHAGPLWVRVELRLYQCSPESIFSRVWQQQKRSRAARPGRLVMHDLASVCMYNTDACMKQAVVVEPGQNGRGAEARLFFRRPRAWAYSVGLRGTNVGCLAPVSAPARGGRTESFGRSRLCAASERTSRHSRPPIGARFSRSLTKSSLGL
jgi:hypothetical protein